MQLGINAGDSVGVLCRNHRYIVELGGTLAKMGAHAVYLNTGFASHQLQSVYEREGAVALVHDEEFTEIAIDAGIATRFVAWGDSSDITAPTLDHLATRYAYGERLERPEQAEQFRHPHVGHHGRAERARAAISPRAARRRSRCSTASPTAPRETMVVAAPIFHSWGRPTRSTGLLFGNTTRAGAALRSRADARRDRATPRRKCWRQCR